MVGLGDHNAQRVDLLMGDRITLRETVWIVEEEAYAARVAWNHSIGLSQETYQELQTHRDHVYAHETHLQTYQTQLQLQSTLIQTQHQVSETRFQMQQTAMAKLRETDRGRQAQLTEALRCQRHEAEEGRHAARVASYREQLMRRDSPGRMSITPDHQEATGTRGFTLMPVRLPKLAIHLGTNFVSTETEKVPNTYSGLPDNIMSKVKSARPQTLDETIELGQRIKWIKSYAPYARDRLISKMKSRRHHHETTTTFQENLGRECARRAPKSTGNTNATNNRSGNGPNPKGNGCFECGNPGHFKRDCPKLKNKNGGNGNAQGWVYVVVIKRNGNAVGNTGLKHRHDLMPVELGSFDAIIGMDWLRRHHAKIMCDEKLVRVPFGNENLDLRGAENINHQEMKILNSTSRGTYISSRDIPEVFPREVISCSKVQEYMAKGCHVFLAQISAIKEDDKSEGKQVKDVPIVRDFPEVFPEDLPGLPPVREPRSYSSKRRMAHSECASTTGS
ncbi:putative reverse transcriptase domain-containing protein, partial [Tanacetum coccineum]